MKRVRRDIPKVFGVGFQKTGTSSLQSALKALGYRVTGPNFTTNRNLESGVVERAVRIARKYDAFQDNPWPLLYREMDMYFPGSKFILTVRDPDAWIASIVRHFGGKTTPMREWIYDGCGDPLGNEELYVRIYNDHNRRVRSYFEERPEDLLTINITEGQGWEVLCPFLGKAIPERAFPHTNKALMRESDKTKVIKDVLKKFKRFKESF